MENPINITWLNDFIFCPVSIYFHSLYELTEDLYQTSDQIEGKMAHNNVDNKKYHTSQKTIKSLEVYSNRYNLYGKIDIYYEQSKTLVERKKLVKNIYDGYVFQLYAQYFAMKEMGYEIEKLVIRSVDDNKSYDIELPEDNHEMLEKFENVRNEMEMFKVEGFRQSNIEKCRRCIYHTYCEGCSIYDDNE